MLFSRNAFTKIFFLFMMFCIYSIVAKHFEMFFGDVDNKFLDEVQSRNGFSNSFVVFVSGVMKGYIFAVIIINTRCSNNRSAEVPADVFNGNIRRAKIWLCMNIKTVGVFCVHFIFNFMERWTDAGSKLFKQHFAKGITKEFIIKVFHRTPGSDVASPTLGDEGMDMGIPLQVTPKGVKNADKSRGKVFSFIHFRKHTKDNVADRMK